MRTPDARLDILRRQNPFTSSSVGDPWDHQYPHVPSINARAFDGLCRLIAQKTHDPALNCAGLILGEVGSGKTHLLGRLLAYSRQAQPSFAFAYVQPLEDPEQTFQYLLREMMVNLSHPLPESPYATQLERLVAAIFTEVIAKHGLPKGKQKLQKILRDNLHLFTHMRPAIFPYVQKRAIDLLSLAYPEMSSRFLNVLFQYRLMEKRAAAVNWLKGSVLDNAEADVLDVPAREHASPGALEQEARDILTSLGLLLTRYRQPLLICFDRLENLDTDAHLHALGKMLEFLVDKAKGMLPIVCARGMQWEERFRYTLNQHVTSRLETNPFVLQGCTAEQALELVRCRLASVLDVEAAAELFPFDREELRQTFHTGFHSPRVVIARANERLRHLLDEGPPALETPLQTLQEAFNRQYQTIVRDFKRYQPDRGRLRRALELYLSYSPAGRRSRFEPLTRPKKDRKYVDVITTVQSSGAPPAPAMFLIDVEYNHVSVAASLIRGIEFLTSHPSGQAFYIRDARCHFPAPPRWQATNDKLQRFKALGGQVILLKPEQAARWYALALLSYAVREGDITLVNAEHRLQAVSSDEFATFVQETIHGQRDLAFADVEVTLEKASPAQSDSPPMPQPISDRHLTAERVSELLRTVPAMMLASDKLGDALAQSGHPIDLHTLLTALRSFPERFTIIPSKDDVVITLNKSWVHAQS
jgi:hypothetical protein